MQISVTTGTCAAAASKASAIYLISGECPETVTVKNLQGHEFILEVFKESEYFGVVKHSYESTDVTDGVKVLARVEILDGEDDLIFTAGEGVGIITLPGLKLPVGEPAINPVPREMIKRSVREIIPRKKLRITISIPDGEKIAKRTFNPRLGIKGGLSVLGTTGTVKPMNEEALLSSLSLELNMIYSLGFRELYITFAGTGENFTRKIFNINGRNVIQCGNYIGHVLDNAEKLGFENVIICGHAGKILKVSSGNFNTHSRISDGRLESLCTHLALEGANSDIIRRIYHSNTVNEAIEIVKSEGFFRVWNNIAETVSRKCKERTHYVMKVDTVIIDGSGGILGVYHES